MNDSPIPAADLDLLCQRYGIALSYRDIWFHDHATPEATKRALLAAMGVPLEGPDAGQMPPTGTPAFVHIEGDPEPVLTFAGSTLATTAPWRWKLTLEHGAVREGECEASFTPDGPAEAAARGGSSAVAAATADASASLPETARGRWQVTCNGVTADLPFGYHVLSLHAVEGPGGSTAARTAHRSRASAAAAHTVELIACPQRCSPIPGPEGARHFGPAIQLYSLRSRRNWGIGDFTDLASLARIASAQGASFIGVNPLHELFADRPQVASPYSPSSRLAVNTLYVDVEAVEEFVTTREARAFVSEPAFAARLAALRATELVDYAAVAAAKREVLALLYAAFRRDHLAHDTPRAQAFRTFVLERRGELADAARFDALQARFAKEHGAWGWPVWGDEYRDRAHARVEALAAELATDIDYHLYLQWQADLQLAHAAQVAREAGMAIGLYRDLAVGANPGGAETWHDPQRFARGVHVGAPPDEFNQAGQDWGLPPWIPHRLATDGFRAFRELVAANMRHAGGLRIDHVMGLARLYWIPEGAAASEGAYVRYPLREMVGVLALESRRHGALVVGEDLGTVPDDFRATTSGAGIVSYRVLYFERAPDGDFLAPTAYPVQALVTISTHDLPTLEGYWQGTDLGVRDALALFPSPELRERLFADRAADRERLPRALAREGLPAPDPTARALTRDEVAGVHAYVARTPCALMTLQLEDVFGQTEQANVPATTEDMQPNWRRKTPLDLEDWDADGRFAAICAAIRAQRPAPA